MSKYTDTANAVWFLFGGLVIAIEYVLGSLLMLVSVIGIPFAKDIPAYRLVKFGPLWQNGFMDKNLLVDLAFSSIYFGFFWPVYGSHFHTLFWD